MNLDQVTPLNEVKIEPVTGQVKVLSRSFQHAEFLSFIFILGLLFVGCGDDEDECDTMDVTYTNSVASIFPTPTKVAQK